MGAERSREAAREFQLEGVGLIVVAVLLLGSLVGAFYLGRWYERRSTPPSAAAAAADPLGNVERVPGGEVDAGEDLTFFDTLSGEGKAAEPKREARRPEPTTRQPAPASAPATGAAEEVGQEPPPAAAAEENGFFVQVFAGRVRESAEKLVRELEGRGYRVRVESSSEGQERLYRVQVGGYPSRDEALRAVEKLRGEGYPTAFVASR